MPPSRSVTFISSSDGRADVTITATNADGCSAQGAIAMGITAPPPIYGFTTVPASVCPNGVAAISTTNVQWFGVTYTWSVVDGDVVSGAGTSAITFRPHPGVSSVTVRKGWVFASHAPNSLKSALDNL